MTASLKEITTEILKALGAFALAIALGAALVANRAADQRAMIETLETTLETAKATIASQGKQLDSLKTKTATQEEIIAILEARDHDLPAIPFEFEANE